MKSLSSSNSNNNYRQQNLPSDNNTQSETSSSKNNDASKTHSNGPRYSSHFSHSNQSNNLSPPTPPTTPQQSKLSDGLRYNMGRSHHKESHILNEQRRNILAPPETSHSHQQGYSSVPGSSSNSAGWSRFVDSHPLYSVHHDPSNTVIDNTISGMNSTSATHGLSHHTANHGSSGWSRFVDSHPSYSNSNIHHDSTPSTATSLQDYYLRAAGVPTATPGFIDVPEHMSPNLLTSDPASSYCAKEAISGLLAGK